MSAVERLAILISADGSGAIREFGKVGDAAERELGKTESKLDKVGSRMTSTGAVMMGASAVMVAGLYNAGQSAAELEQSVGGSEAVFKDSAAGMRDWSKSAATSVGLSENLALSLSTRLGGALKGLGYDQQEAADQSRELVTVAADLAATYGGTTADAVAALGSAFRGEFDPAEQFNLFLKQSTVDAKAVEMGLAKTTSEVDANARAQATLALITEQSADAQGQFARETDSTSGRLQIASAQFENLKAQIGAGFTPVMTTAGQAAGAAATGIAAADAATGGLSSQIVGYGSVALGGAGATSFLVGQVISARDNFKSAKNSLGSFTSSMNVSRGSAIAGAGAMAVLGVAVFAYQKHLEGAREEGRKMASDVAGSGGPAEQMTNLRNRLDEVNKELEDLGPAGMTGFEGLTQWADGTDAARGRLEEQKTSLESQVEGLEKSTEATKAATDASGGHTQAIEEETVAIENKQEAYLAMAGGQLGLQSAQIAAREELVAYNTAMADGTLSANEREQAGVDLLQSYMREAEAAAGLAEEIATTNGEQFTAADRAAVQKQRLEELAGTLAPGSPLRAQLQGYIDKLGEIPPSINTIVDVDTGAAYEGVSRLTAYIRNLPSAQLPVGIGRPGWVGGGQERAMGGPVSPWSVYKMHDTDDIEVLRQNDGTSLVFTGSQGGMVENLGNSAKAMTGGSGRSAGSDGRPLVVNLVLDGAQIGRVAVPGVRVAERERS